VGLTPIALATDSLTGHIFAEFGMATGRPATSIRYGFSVTGSLTLAISEGLATPGQVSKQTLEGGLRYNLV
jgi:hypothetical protein